MNYEKEMKTVPGFKPPGGGIWIPEADADLEQVLGEKNDKNLRLRFLSYGLPVRLYEVLKKYAKASAFRDERHEKVVTELLGGELGDKLRRNKRFLASSYLLSADEWLWERAREFVTLDGICFEKISVRGASADERFLFLGARQVQARRELLTMENLDDEAISEAALGTYLNAMLMIACGVKVLEKGSKKN